MSVYSMPFTYRAIGRSTGYLEMSPQRCTNIVVASAVLHNIAREGNIPDTDSDTEEVNNMELDLEGAAFDTREGTQVRRRLIDSRFSHVDNL